MYNFWQRVKRFIGYGGLAAGITVGMMHPAGLDLVKEFEGGCDGPAGAECAAYVDSHAYGKPITQGYGHTNRAPGGVRAVMGTTWTEEFASEVLDQDLKAFWDAVDAVVVPELTQCQMSVLTSWTHNVGPGAMRKSTLIKRINAGRLNDVPAQLMRWNRAGGKVLRGLTRRRAAEARLWSTNCGDN